MRAKTLMFAIVVTVLVLLPAGPCLADDGGDFEDQYLGVFIGATDWDHSNNREFTAGLHWEYRFHEYVGAGLLAEVGDVGNDTYKAAIAIWVHPFADLRLVVAPGYEFIGGDDEEFVRGGIGWDFHAGDNFVITPNFNIDFMDPEDVYVYGIDFGFTF